MGMFDFSKLQDYKGATFEDAELRKGIMPPLKERPEEEEQEAEAVGELTEVAKVIGPTDFRGIPLKYAYRRAFSEMQLLDAMQGEEFRDGYCYCFLTRGDVDLISYLKIVSRQQHIHHLGVATWNANIPDFETLAYLKRKGRIGAMDIFLGSINRAQSEARKNVNEYRRIMAEFPDVTIKVVKTHIKTFYGDGDRFPFVITGSPNLNTNVNSEAVCVIIDRGAYEFYRDFFQTEKTCFQ